MSLSWYLRYQILDDRELFQLNLDKTEVLVISPETKRERNIKIKLQKNKITCTVIEST